ncbi:MAG TPA: serine hydrolase domain-containing protein [Patescibacteria group bacterium]|nr:serine hydrolase domain-containing protein [Patescibacteria group bacterium]
MDNLNSHKLQAATNYIDSWLTFNFDNSRVPAMSVAIQHGDKLVYSKAFGHANLAKKDKLTTDHTFRIASHSKTFTATAVAQLKEAGKLRLDDTVSQHLKWFKSTKDKRISELTIRQLLNHTAGVIRDGEDANYWQLLRKFPDEAELKQYITSAKLIYDADVEFKYSNFGFSYLGLLIEAVSGKSYRQYVTENIVNKLGLKSTGPDLDAKANKTLATGYGIMLFNKDRRVFDHIDTRAMSSATGFYSTAEDVCKYFAAHFFGNSTLITDASKREMQHGYWKAKFTKERYGLGMVNYKKKGWTIYGHSGGFPGFITNTQFDAKRQLVVTSLTNANEGVAKKATTGILSIIDTFQQDTPEKSKTGDIKAFAGRFYGTWGATDVIAVGNKLMAIEPTGWNDDFEQCQKLSVVDSKTLKIDEAGGYDSPGEIVNYEFGTNGKAKTITYAGTKMLPLEQAKKEGWF